MCCGQTNTASHCSYHVGLFAGRESKPQTLLLLPFFLWFRAIQTDCQVCIFNRFIHLRIFSCTSSSRSDFTPYLHYLSTCLSLSSCWAVMIYISKSTLLVPKEHLALFPIHGMCILFVPSTTCNPAMHPTHHGAPRAPGSHHLTALGASAPTSGAWLESPQSSLSPFWKPRTFTCRNKNASHFASEVQAGS